VGNFRLRLVPLPVYIIPPLDLDQQEEEVGMERLPNDLTGQRHRGHHEDC